MEPTVSTSAPQGGFYKLGLPAVLNGVLFRLNLTNPTPIQEQAIPVALTGVDVIGLAQTGTGKTFAFALPTITKLLAGNGRALVLVPTRELALQVEESIRRLTNRLNPQIRTVCLIGGMSINGQIQALRHHHKPRIIIATPGRLNDHLNQSTVNLSDVDTLILDEADRMLDMGFLPQIRRVVEALPAERQTLLFSATLAPEIARLAADYQKNPVRIEVAVQGTTAAQIEQEMCYVSKEGKNDLLAAVLDEHAEGPVLVFTRTKHGASRLATRLQHTGHAAAEIHSDRSLGQRRHALEGFKSGKFRVLVATDVAARGIDVTGIALVVNFDLPDAPEDYVHRIGRTGRAGRDGRAISFATPDQGKDVKAIERLIGRSIPVSHRSLPVPAAVSSPAFSSNRPGQRSGGSKHFGRPRRGFRR